ncbi:NUDIX hydrolase [Brucella sp. BE17]|uniref:NUDIX hydrolase n=1 Tax=Brucella sp. BE17 TaxID=3142977 RepID=UPI0031BB3818
MQLVKENTVHVLDAADVRVVPGPLAYTQQNKALIAANWQREYAAKPALFDGEVFLAPNADLQNGVLQASFQRTSFATLMYWRQDPETVRPWHIFAIGVIVSREGHLIAARMSNQSAVGGRIYFPAGSIDDNDVIETYADFEGNMRREVLEETGLDIRKARAEPQFNLVTANRSIALFRRHRFDLSTKQIVAEIEKFMAAQSEPELAEIIPVTAHGEMGDATPSYVRAFADWHFGYVNKPC